MKQLPEESNLTPGDDLDMNVIISTTAISEDGITLSLKHYSDGIYNDLTKYLVYDLSDNTDDSKYDKENARIWKIDMTLPYPHSQASGDLILSVKDDHSGGETSTRLVIAQEGNDGLPFFDPIPSSVTSYTGEDLFIETKVKGLTPLIVSIMIIVEVYFSALFLVELCE